MRKSILILAAIIALISCREDQKKDIPEADATAKVQLTANGQPVGLYDTVALGTDEHFYLSLFKFYLSRLTLSDANGQEFEIKDVALLSPAVDTANSFSLRIPEGNYRSLTMGFGVDAEQNAMDPASFEREHPLSAAQTMHWSMLKYRFAKFEGTFFMPDTISILSYHPGTNPLYQVRTFELSEELVVDQASDYQLSVVLDFPLLFDGPGGKIQLPEEYQTHSEAADIHIAEKFMQNLAASASLSISKK